jgi:transcriptional regulator with XRE-family HTH domain
MSVSIDIEKIEKQRIRQGLQKSELARRAGISPGRYTQILSEARQGKLPFAPTIKQIVQALGMSMEEILVEEETEKATA